MIPLLKYKFVMLLRLPTRETLPNHDVLSVEEEIPGREPYRCDERLFRPDEYYTAHKFGGLSHIAAAVASA
jgi:hypothetical protein